MRSHLIAGLLEHLSIDPTHDVAARSAAAQPQCVIRVFRKDQMVGGETGADQRKFLGTRIVHRDMPGGAFEGKNLGRRMIRTFLAEGRVRWRTNSRGKPNSRFLIVHGVVLVGL
ncbi:MAG TPA: hypothetical protein VLJ17_20060, partial [Xanthobacteraceae bacterium]|nr:hypothetical protein [Xanthobacteraceae bacterium]